MNNEIGLLVQDLPQEDADRYIKETKSSFDAKHNIQEIEIDYSWVDTIEEAIPAIDNIIRNPRRFIVSEEDVVRIEKTKKISLESIKDLAVHTNYIQEVDDDGFVKPIKLLNIFKEETIDLYENRFIYTLITTLNRFVEEQLTYKEQSANNTNEKKLNYNSETFYDDQNISLKLEVTAKKNVEVKTDEKELRDREEKIEHIKNVLEDFMSSKFMKMMKGATIVRSPIRNTNVILKDYNFVTALHLWETIEDFEINSPVKEKKEETDLSTPSMKHNLDLTSFLNYCILNDTVSKRGSVLPLQNIDIVDAVYEYASKFDIDEKELRKNIESKITAATEYKNAEKDNARKAYKSFIDNHNSRFNKAVNLFK